MATMDIIKLYGEAILDVGGGASKVAAAFKLIYQIKM